MGEQHALLLSQHNSLVMIVNAALGGGSKDTGGGRPPRRGDPGVRDLAAGHATVEDAVAAINAAFTI